MTSSGVTTEVIEVTSNSWPEGLTGAVLQAAQALGQRQPGDDVVFVVSNPPQSAGHRDALREALRSVVHASILERPKLRANVVFGGTEADRAQTVAYVIGAPFVSGAILDLGAAQ